MENRQPGADHCMPMRLMVFLVRVIIRGIREEREEQGDQGQRHIMIGGGETGEACRDHLNFGLFCGGTIPRGILTILVRIECRDHRYGKKRYQ